MAKEGALGATVPGWEVGLGLAGDPGCQGRARELPGEQSEGAVLVQEPLSTAHVCTRHSVPHLSPCGLGTLTAPQHVLEAVTWALGDGERPPWGAGLTASVPSRAPSCSLSMRCRSRAW